MEVLNNAQALLVGGTVTYENITVTVLESGADQKVAESLNDGIVYLMVIPYILGAVTLYFLYTKFFKK